jgi:RNA polymerase sigma-70 factor, ECF subfamily
MDEAKLLKAAKKFDQEALQIIFDTYSPAIYKYALRLCHDSIEADNFVGDVFALLLEQFADAKGPNTNLRSYMFQITYHVIVDQARNRRHISPLELADFQGENDSPVALQAEKDAALETLISAMTSELNPDQFHVLSLRFMEGFSVRETADIIGKSVNNVKVIQNRAIEKLRQALNRKIETKS